MVAVEKNIMTAHRNGKRSYYDSIRKDEDRTANQLSFFRGGRAMISKQCKYCGKWIPVDQTCSCHAAARKEGTRQRNHDYDTHRRNKDAAAFYSSPEWITTRNAVLNLDQGIDVYRYMTTGEIRAADTVHHIIPLRDDWGRRLDTSNLISVCSSTKSKIEREYRRVGKREMQKKLSEMLKQYRQQTSE